MTLIDGIGFTGMQDLGPERSGYQNNSNYLKVRNHRLNRGTS